MIPASCPRSRPEAPWPRSTDRLGAVELTTNRRQEQSWERAALDELRHGSVRRGLGSFVAADRVHVAPSMAETRRALVDAWLTAVQKGKEAVMLAVTRGDVAALNETARAALRVAGRLGPDALVVDEQGFAIGDLVVCGRNDRTLGVVNGTRGTIRSVEAGTVILDTGRGPRRLSADYLDQGHLSYGYALTVHKSQGATLDRAFVLATSSLTREAGYVALSRARQSTDLFVPTSPFEDGLGEPEHQHPRSVPATTASSRSPSGSASPGRSAWRPPSLPTPAWPCPPRRPPWPLSAPSATQQRTTPLDILSR